VIRALVFAVFATAAVGCSGTLGEQTRDQLREGITGQQAALQACYAEALGRNRDAAGAVNVAVHVKSEEKSVHQVDVGETAIDDAEMQACVQRTLSGVTIAQGPDSNVAAHFVLDFQPSGDAPAPEPAPAEGADATDAPEGGEAAE
jgi:hypothetical protein